MKVTITTVDKDVFASDLTPEVYSELHMFLTNPLIHWINFRQIDGGKRYINKRNICSVVITP